MTFVPVTAAPRPAKPDDLWIPVRGRDVGLAPGGGWLTVADAGDAAITCVGAYDDGRLVWTGPGVDGLSYTTWWLAAADPAYDACTVVRAAQIATWRAAHRFCGACAQPLEDCPGYLSRECPACGEQYWVRLSPVALVLVTHGDKVLLLRHSYMHQRMWAQVSGYAESGESLEDTARREVREETGLEVARLTYTASAVSGFGDPSAVLVAFRAEAAGTELDIDPGEIAEARWFTREEIAALGDDELPPAGTLALALIRGV